MNPRLSLELRPIVDGDLPFLAELYASTRAEEMAQVAWEPEAVHAFLLDQFQLQHQHYQTHYTGTAFDLLLVDGMPAGRRYLARGATEIRLVDLALLPAFRGLGIGRHLMLELLEESDRTGLPVSLHVEQNNPALAWYHRLGFRELDTHGVYFRMERQSMIAEPQP